MFGNLTPVEIEETLTANVIGRLGCSDGNRIYIIPISYAYKDNVIYCHTREGLKMDIMRKFPNVCFQVDELSDMANWKSVIAWGKFEEVPNRERRRLALEQLVRRVLPIVSSETTHLSPSWPFPPDDLNEIQGIVFRINLDSKTGKFEHHLDEHVIK
jgi:uncharacterized protein